MTEQLQSRLFVHGYLVAAFITALLAGGLAVSGRGNLALGLAAGAAIALLMIHGTVKLGIALVDRSGDEAQKGRRFRRALAFQIGKYIVAIGALYLLVTRWEIDPIGLAVGYGIPLVVLVVVGLRVRTARPTQDR